LKESNQWETQWQYGTGDRNTIGRSRVLWGTIQRV
jgi:hypothetical protein